MHIPDGYLSPLTCVVGYAAVIPFWWLALRKVQRRLTTRLVPTMAVFTAFSFVVMMFNLPIPGGTTAHAIGIGIATIVLGPWAAMLAVSMALLIQALFFGDGGITTFAFNSLNMAVIGAGVAWAAYRLGTRGAASNARRVAAAAVAGYLAINAAGLATAVELGLQPLLFHTADGTPLYAPYPLHVAIPAMAIAHLTLAGVAELVATAGILAWLQKSNPEWLELGLRAPRAPRRVTVRRLWLGLAVMMILTPLGLLATATAWGEWAPGDFATEHALITAQSLNHAAPTVAPAGMARLASVWTSPIPDYAPAFMRSEMFGYMLSAVVGTGLIVLVWLLLAALLGRQRRPARD
ncbi:cobalt transporter CbiM [Castellaniella sp.]|uniref:cobalt transporter CbiM n=1 Tax=Castellaniella sp. TaxID=1955812 RepID=UPI003C751720